MKIRKESRLESNRPGSSNLTQSKKRISIQQDQWAMQFNLNPTEKQSTVLVQRSNCAQLPATTYKTTEKHVLTRLDPPTPLIHHHTAYKMSKFVNTKIATQFAKKKHAQLSSTEQRQNSSKILCKNNIKDSQNSNCVRESIDFCEATKWQRNTNGMLNNNILQTSITLTPQLDKQIKQPIIGNSNQPSQEVTRFPSLFSNNQHAGPPTQSLLNAQNQQPQNSMHLPMSFQDLGQNVLQNQNQIAAHCSQPSSRITNHKKSRRGQQAFEAGVHASPKAAVSGGYQFQKEKFMQIPPNRMYAGRKHMTSDSDNCFANQPKFSILLNSGNLNTSVDHHAGILGQTPHFHEENLIRGTADGYGEMQGLGRDHQSILTSKDCQQFKFRRRNSKTHLQPNSFQQNNNKMDDNFLDSPLGHCNHQCSLDQTNDLILSPQPNAQESKCSDIRRQQYQNYQGQIPWSNPENKLVVCTYNTQYEVITRAAKSVGLIDRRADPGFFKKQGFVNTHQNAAKLHTLHGPQITSFSQRFENHNLGTGLIASNKRNLAQAYEHANKIIQIHKQLNTVNAVNPDDFDVFWFDTAIQPDILGKLKPFQRVSQWPGIHVVAHKNRLGQNLMNMRKQFPEHYDFFPVTYMLPNEMNLFRKEFLRSKDQDGPQKKDEDDTSSTAATSTTKKVPDTKNNEHKGSSNRGGQLKTFEKSKKRRPIVEKQVLVEDKIFIVKPDNESQGKGIFLTNSWEDIANKDKVVAQHYIDPPYLIDDLKFDMRVYVLLYGVNPLRIYLFDDGLCRFATAPYKSPNQSNMRNVFMHLTNYSINKNNNKFQHNQDDWGTDGHKRSLKMMYMNIVQREGKKTGWPKIREMQRKVKDIIIKTLITGQPHLSHLYKTSQPEDVENQLCFQILGFDIMLDAELNPWLIEVNHAPSMGTDSSFDKAIKLTLIEDTLKLLNLSQKRKSDYIKTERQNFQQRTRTGKADYKLTQEQKEQKRKEIDQQRCQVEKDLLGSFELIYPLEDTQKNQTQIELYGSFIDHAQKLYDKVVNVKNKRTQRGKNG